MATLELSVASALSAQYSGINNLGLAVFDLEEREPLEFASGKGSGMADTLLSQQRTLAASASEILDLINGSLLDSINLPLALRRIKVIHVRASVSNINDVVIGGAGAGGLTGPFVNNTNTYNIPPGGAFLAVHPGVGWLTYDVSEALFKVANGGAGTSVIYDLEIAGETP